VVRVAITVCIVLSLKQLVSPLNPTKISGNLDGYVRSISFDSRKVHEGDIFVAIKGSNADGNHYLEDAVAAGAAAIVTDAHIKPNGVPCIHVENARVALARLAAEWHQHPEQNIKLTGVTGTNGKTTTAYLIRAILETAGHSTGLLGTIEYLVGDKSIPAALTTPEPTNLYDYLARMIKSGQTHAVMVVTSHALAQDRTHGLKFERAVFTNFSHEHLDFHETRENYLQAKMKLFQNLDTESVAILNQDTPESARLKARTKATTLSFSTASNGLAASDCIRASRNGNSVVDVRFRNQKMQINSKLPGDFNLGNILAAVAVGVSYDLEPSLIKRGVESVEGIPGRLELITTVPFAVYVDFAHTPESLKQTLRSGRKNCRGRIIIVFGCGGNRDKVKRPQMGKIAEQGAELIFLTSDNPRDEDPMQILNEIDRGISDKSKRVIIPDRKTAIAEAISRAEPDDIIIIAGKGHETHQEICGERLPFDDRRVARELLNALNT
ncbi:MAG: UDP-N-acetylmuramoyl-L-alanyl-D-glutamate--2,6-diaminopimelate ligase, partial [bacterium]